jgi:hypothetical protein
MFSSFLSIPFYSRKVMSYLASIPSSEKRRTRKVIAAAIPKLQYPFKNKSTSSSSSSGTNERLSPYSIAQFSKITKPSGKEVMEGDPLKTSAVAIVTHILEKRFQISTCSKVNCPMTKFSLVDDVAFSNSHSG